MGWNIILYETSRGDKPVQNFIEKLNTSTIAKVIHHIDLLEVHGNLLRMPYSKKISNNIYELRIRGKEEIRIFYCFSKKNKIYLLHIFKKKSQRIPKKEITISENRFKEILDSI